MLMVVLVAAAALRLGPLSGAQPLCRVRTVRTGKVFRNQRPLLGRELYFSSNTAILIDHPCEHTVLYLGRQVFLSTDDFESSLQPLKIPLRYKVRNPVVSSAHFSGHVLFLIVDRKLYGYKYHYRSWSIPQGIKEPVTHISGENCCVIGNSICTQVNGNIFVYRPGDELSQSAIYFSYSGGSYFEPFNQIKKIGLTGTLEGIFYFHAMSQVGTLLVKNGTGRFYYLSHPLNLTPGLEFNYSGTLNILLTPYQKGFLILWNENTLLVSPNSGQLINPVHVSLGKLAEHHSILESRLTIHTISANANELAVLTQQDILLYGSLEILSNIVIKLPEQPFWSPNVAIMFLRTGMVEVLSPLPDASFPTFDFEKCLLNIQAILMNPNLHVDKCKIEFMYRESSKNIYTIDMNSELNLSAILIPRKGTAPIPLVMVSNPYSLGMQASMYELEHTLDGNTKFKLDIHLKQQQHWGRTSPNFTSRIERPTMSTLTVDIANKEISCVDMEPLTVFISVGCDQEKRILVEKKTTACSMGILDPVLLQKNYTYTLHKGTYDPTFQGIPATKERIVSYPYKYLGCPLLVYYDTPWKPVIELWRGQEFQELVDAEFVLQEMNGLFTYSYSMTAREAGCIRQPQNWSTIMQFEDAEIFNWNRQYYVSCHDPNNPNPLEWPDVEYQILGGPTNNEVIFDQRNGMYIFLLSIVDPNFSYCQLYTVFSVYVHGAYPLHVIPAEPAILLLLLAILLTVWLAYVVPRRLCTEGCCQRLRQRCRALWPCCKA